LRRRSFSLWLRAGLVAMPISLLMAGPARSDDAGPNPADAAAPNPAPSSAAVGPTSPARLWAVLTYSVDPEMIGCPAEADFRESVARQLGYDPFRSDATHRIIAEVNASGEGIDGRLLWTDAHGQPEGERRLVSAVRNCGEFVKEMTFALAVQIQLLSTAAAAEPPVPAPLPPPAPPPPPPPAPPSPAKPAAEVAERAVFLGLGPTGEVGIVPSFTGGLRLFAGVRRGVLSVEMAAEATLPVTLRQADGTGFSATAFGATLAPCGHRGPLALCAVGMLGLLDVRGFGVDDPRSPSSLVARVGLRLAFGEPLSLHWAAGVHVDGLVSLTPRTVSLNELPVWTTPPVALVVGIDLAAHLR
jgi:hypothetical protein